MEHDVSGLVLSVCARMKQPFLDDTGIQRVLFADEPQQQPPLPSSVKPVIFCPPVEKAALDDDEQPAVGPSQGGLPSEKNVATEEECQVYLSSIIASTDMHKSVLPEMLRAQECIER